MTHDDAPDYGTPPEPKYGQYDEEQVLAAGRPPVPSSRTNRVAYPPRREPAGIVLAVFLLVFGAVFAGLALMGGWWALMWALAGPFLLFGAVGLAIDVPKVPRDENGRPL